MNKFADKRGRIWILGQSDWFRDPSLKMLGKAGAHAQHTHTNLHSNEDNCWILSIPFGSAPFIFLFINLGYDTPFTSNSPSFQWFSLTHCHQFVLQESLYPALPILVSHVGHLAGSLATICLDVSVEGVMTLCHARLIQGEKMHVAPGVPANWPGWGRVGGAGSEEVAVEKASKSQSWNTGLRL